MTFVILFNVKRRTVISIHALIQSATAGNLALVTQGFDVPKVRIEHTFQYFRLHFLKKSA